MNKKLSQINFRLLAVKYGIFLVFILMVVMAAMLSPHFLEFRNLDLEFIYLDFLLFIGA